jgi:predicted ester cyclase
MSLEENKAVVRRHLEEIWNKKNFEVAGELVDTHFNANHPERMGPEGEKRFVTSFHTRFPGWHFNIEDMIAEGDKIVVYWEASGKHEGEFKGFSPTGKPFTLKGFSLYRVAGGKIVGTRFSVWDRFGLMEQVGAFSPQEQAS